MSLFVIENNFEVHYHNSAMNSFLLTKFAYKIRMLGPNESINFIIKAKHLEEKNIFIYEIH
jgi:hypothetical protein